MTVTTLIAPAALLIDLAAAKLFLRVDHDHEDALITSLIETATARVEQLTGRAMLTRTLRAERVAGKGAQLVLRPAPFIALIAVRAIAIEAITPIPLTDVRVHSRIEPAQLTLPQSFSGDAVQIDYEVGYGPDPNAVPLPLRQAVLLLLGQSYELRGNVEGAPLPMMVDALLMPYRSYRL